MYCVAFVYNAFALFYRESDSVVKLLPENDALEPIIVNAADVQILGKVVGIFRDNIM